ALAAVDTVIVAGRAVPTPSAEITLRRLAVDTASRRPAAKSRISNAFAPSTRSLRGSPSVIVYPLAAFNRHKLGALMKDFSRASQARGGGAARQRQDARDFIHRKFLELE